MRDWLQSLQNANIIRKFLFAELNRNIKNAKFIAGSNLLKVANKFTRKSDEKRALYFYYPVPNILPITFSG